MRQHRIDRWMNYPLFSKQACTRTGSFLLLAGLYAPTAIPQSAKTWDKRGTEAEIREDYDKAYEAFRQAYLLKPKDLRYKTRYERLRFEAANQHVDRGRVLRQSGDLGGAINEFARALQVDPGNQAAAQELQVTQAPGTATPQVGSASQAGTESQSGAPVPNDTALANAGPGSRALIPGLDEQTPHQRDVQREIISIAAPVTLQSVTTDPITLHMVEDTKVIYQAIGKVAGLNVIFDPQYNSKRIPVDLTSVSLQDALRITGILSGSFWKAVTPNTIFVAENNQTKRKDFEDLAVQTFYLTNVAQQNDANEILVALRNLLGSNNSQVSIYLVASQNAIVVRATSDQLVLAQKIINDLDRTRSEVVVDLAVLEVSRDKIRQLGITLPTTFGLTPTASTSTSSTSTSTTGTSTGTTTTPTTSTNLTLNSLGNLNATNFAVTVSGGTVSALLSDADTRVLQNPRIRATDGQRATLKIGSRIPVATGSYNAGVSTGIASIGVQTQFQYLDVGVNIDITPTVHYDREVSLKMRVEVSNQNGNVSISGVTEPIIAQRISEQTIQLKEGEPSILAGLLQRQDTKSVDGTPGLGEIPLLKYFFSTQKKEQQNDEIVFLLIPHIVRESLLSDENTRAIYTGTQGAVELIRRDPVRASPSNTAAASGMRSTNSSTTAANAAAAMLPEIAAAGRPLSPTAATDIPSSAAAGTTPVNLTIVPPAAKQAIGSLFQVTVTAANAHDLFSVPLQMHFDPRVLSLVNVDAGDLLGRDGQAVALVHRDEGNGTVTISASRPPNLRGVDGQGSVCTLTFKALAAGDASLQLVKIGAKDSQQRNLPAVGSQAVVHVQ